MSKAAQRWERYLFYQHHLVALRPLNRDLQLLDVLVKKGSHGLPLTGDHGPTIVRIGSILSLRSHDDNPDWEEWANHAKDSLRRLRHNEELESDELFCTGSIGDYESNTEFASNMRLSLSSLVGIEGHTAKSWSGSALNVTYEKFTEDSAKNLFYSDTAAVLWKPDLQRIKLEQPSIRSNGTLDLWVVKEIQYAKEIKISASSDYGAHGGVDLASVAGIPIPLAGGTLQVEAKVGKAKDGATEDVEGQKVPYAFKAIRLVYREDGKLIAKNSDMGTKRLHMRMKVDPSTFFNADKDPIYHMGGLFAQAPGEGDDEEEGVQLLDVVTNGDGPTKDQ